MNIIVIGNIVAFIGAILMVLVGFIKTKRNILIAQNVTKKRAEEIASQFSGTKSVGIIVTDDEIGSCSPCQELVS